MNHISNRNFRHFARETRYSGLIIYWWREELPSPEKYQEARISLDGERWNVNYIITHRGPTSIQNKLLREFSRQDVLTAFLKRFDSVVNSDTASSEIIIATL